MRCEWCVMRRRAVSSGGIQPRSQRRRATSPRPRVESVRSKISKARTSRYTGERTLVLQTCASDGGLKTFFCRLGLGISPAGIVADAISAMGAVALQLFENRSAALEWQRCVKWTRWAVLDACPSSRVSMRR